VSLVRPGIAALSALSCVWGCTLLYDAGDFVAVAESPDTGPPTFDAALPVRDPCSHATPPPRPDASVGGPRQGYVFALSHLAMVGGNADVTGYDLDGVCTCDTRPGAAAGGASSCAPRRPDQLPCDNRDGRDNGLAALFDRLVANRRDGGSIDVGFDIAVSEGVGTVLVEVDEVDGDGDDPEVFVAIYDSPGLDPPRACESGPAGDGGVNAAGDPKPAWTGCDRWKLSESAVLGGSPRTFTRKAWISGGTLVAYLDGMRIRLGRSELIVFDAVLTAKLDRSGRLPQLTQGLVAGRTLSSDILRTVAEQEVEGRPLCRDTLAFGAFRAAACNSLDMAPPGDAAAPCDSISVSVEYDARLARRGSVAPPADAGPRCKDLDELARCP